MKKYTQAKWFNGAVIACIGVAFYCLLTNLTAVTGAVRSFLGCFRPVFLGVVFAYILNSIAKIFYYKAFRRMKLGKVRWTISVILSLVLVLLAITLLLGILIPQLTQSFSAFMRSLEGYISSAIRWMEDGELGKLFDMHLLKVRTQSAIASIKNSLSNNTSQI